MRAIMSVTDRLRRVAGARIWTAAFVCTLAAGPLGAAEIGVRKVRDLVIYEDARFHSAFPSVVKRPDGSFFLGFRRAPDRRSFGEKKNSHVDPNSQLVSVVSRDGETWTKEPALIYAHPLAGAQDPCLLQL